MRARRSRSLGAVGATAAALIALCGPARADDSTAGLENGGLVLTKSSTIAMTSEDLYISDKAIRVHYTFVNTAPTDATVTLAFPMPDITIDGPEGIPMIPKDESDNFLGFTTTVDGTPVHAQLQQKAIQGGVDRTAYLKGLGVPLAPYTTAAGEAVNHLPKAKQDEMVKLGLAMLFSYDEGKGQVNELLATWTLQSKYVWTQTFPAGRLVTIEHDYAPSVGSTVFEPWETDASADSKAQRALYCVDDAFAASVAKATAPNAKNSPGNEEHIDYVLVTGANWKGPIGAFHMVVDKGAAANLVSFCGTGVTKTGPTTFEVRYENFTPKSNVTVMILTANPTP